MICVRWHHPRKDGKRGSRSSLTPWHVATDGGRTLCGMIANVEAAGFAVHLSHDGPEKSRCRKCFKKVSRS